MIDNAKFYLIGTLYPLLTRATYPALGFPQYPGEVGTSEADDAMKAKAVADATEALADPLEVYNTFFLAGKPFIGGDGPSIADFRFAATLEFLRAIDYDLPGWAEDYLERDGGDARRGVLGARRGRAGLHRVREVAGLAARLGRRAGRGHGRALSPCGALLPDGDEDRADDQRRAYCDRD